MPADRDQRLIELFEQAIERPANERQAWVFEVCRDDAELCRKLLALLAADAGHDGNDVEGGEDRLAAIVKAGVRLFAVPPAAVAGLKFGPWRVLEEIGRGGMGAVLLAERADDEYRRRVAIKLIRGFPDRERLGRLRAERQILADLDHPNIARLLDGGSTEDGQPYLVMEFIDGQPIDRWCAERDIPSKERCRMIIDLARAVHYAHQHLVIHRDIKPGNVLVTSDGTPKLLDFGIAKLVEVGGDAAEQTHAHYYTPHYSSPEQRAGRPVSTASDIYSLGRLFETVLKTGGDNRQLSREARAIIARAAAADPRDRYPSASALAADLQRYLDGHPVEALAKRRGYRLWRFVLRHRLAVSAASLGLVIGALLFSQVVIERREARLAATRAEQTLAFLTGLIESARPEAAQGRNLTVAEVLERGDAQLDRGDSSPALRADIAITLASAWHALDEFPRAGELYRRAAAEAARAGDRATELRARAKWLVAATRAGQVREVEAEANQVLADIEAWHSADATLRADVLNDWSVWANEAGRADQAREVLQEVVVLRTDLGDEAALAAAENNLSLSAERLGDYAASLALAEQALARKQRVLGPDHPSTLIGLRVAAVAARKMGKIERSDALLDELLAQRIRLFGADNPALAGDYNERASAVHDAGDYVHAIELYERALTLDAQLEGSPSRHVYLNNLASAHEDRGDFAAAEPPLLESLALREQRFGTDHANTLRARLNLARLRLLQQRLDDALALAAEALTIYRQTLGLGHPDTRYAEWLLAWIGWSAALPDARATEPPIAASEALLADTAAASLRGLNIRGVLARVLIDAGRLDKARTVLTALIEDYRGSFGPNHPKAAELELQLARIELTEDRLDSAAERLKRAAPVLHQALAPTSPALVLLDCLSAVAEFKQNGVSEFGRGLRTTPMSAAAFGKTICTPTSTNIEPSHQAAASAAARWGLPSPPR